ncbi:hypothetical protein [Hyphobacterium sp.]|uniref:hypothetical protein n=1 Tax=Hyphobacterium sp. TaxID=2004662 RepID=UPI003BACF881
MNRRPIIVLHSPEDAQNAFQIARQLIGPDRLFDDGAVRLLTAGKSCRLPLGFETARMVVVTSLSSVNSLAVSRVLDAFLQYRDRHDVMVVVASTTPPGFSEDALISPILMYQRSKLTGFLEACGAPQSFAADLRIDTVDEAISKLEAIITADENNDRQSDHSAGGCVRKSSAMRKRL